MNETEFSFRRWSKHLLASRTIQSISPTASFGPVAVFHTIYEAKLKSPTFQCPKKISEIAR